MLLTNEEQVFIKNHPIIIVGLEIGSVIAECALRMGFENMTIIDGGDVTFLNTISVKKRLLSINKKAKIKVYHCSLTIDVIEKYIEGCSIAINTLSFNSGAAFHFDETKLSSKFQADQSHN